jgi:hypothetical protein
MVMDDNSMKQALYRKPQAIEKYDDGPSMR